MGLFIHDLIDFKLKLSIELDGKIRELLKKVRSGQIFNPEEKTNIHNSVNKMKKY